VTAEVYKVVGLVEPLERPVGSFLCIIDNQYLGWVFSRKNIEFQIFAHNLAGIFRKI